MPKRMITAAMLAIAVPSLCAAHSGAHNGPPPNRPQVTKPVHPITKSPEGVVIAFHRALKLGDTVAALALMAEDVQIYESGSVERSRAEYASHHLAADAEFSAATDRNDIDRVVTQSGDMALVVNVARIKGTFKERAINSRSLESMTLRRIKGEWRIVHIHWSSKALDK